MVKSFRDLIVWQTGMDLAVRIYRMVKDFPPSERYGLSAQLQRAASSIPANIAEGHGRRTSGDFRRGLSIARGSAAELSTHLELALRLTYIRKEVFADLEGETSRVARRITALLGRLPRK